MKMARVFAEGIITSIKMRLERCGFKQNPMRVWVRVCKWDRVRVRRDIRIILRVMFRVR
jgi:hypothetical protein